MRDLYSEVTARIVAKMESGVMPWAKSWNAGTAIPMNAITNRPYSGINVLVFWLSAEKGYARPRYLTFKQALAVGGNVRKGEHGTKIYFFKQLHVADKNDADKQKTIPMLREYTVFNVDQCDNLPDKVRLGEIGVRNADSRETLADEFITATNADFREGAGRPCYVPSQDFITVPSFADFHSMPDYYAAAFHELTHWTGHKTRLDRDLKGRFDQDAYAAEELIAELGAAFLCAEFGFDNTADSHASYLANWLALLKADKRAIFTAASKAQAAADYLRGLAMAEPLAIAA